MFTVWLLGQRATLCRILCITVILAAIVNTKYSGLLAIPILAITLTVRAAMPVDWQILRWTAKTFPVKFLAAVSIGLFALLFSYFAIWACYDFRFAPAPDSDELSQLDQPTAIYASYQSMAEHGATVDTSREEAQKWIAQWQPGPVVRITQWLHDHRLFPETYLRGFLYIAGDTQLRQTFLLGKLRMTGWWYYFPLVIAFKTPLSTLIALAAATIFWLVRRPNFKSWSLFAGAFTPALYFASALHSNTDLGMRHILPIYPFLFIFLGVVSAAAIARYRKFAIPVLCALFLGLAAETFFAYPDFIPFFNVAAGGSRGGLHLLADSNLDWGQDLKLLAAWRTAHPDGQLALCYFGSADPRYYGIHYVNLPASDAPADQPVRTDVPHVYAFSATLLQGLYMESDQRKDYRQFYNYKIAAVLGGSIYVYNQP